MSLKGGVFLPGSESEPEAAFGHDGRLKTLMTLHALTTITHLEGFLAWTPTRRLLRTQDQRCLISVDSNELGYV